MLLLMFPVRFINDNRNTISIKIPSSFLARPSSIELIEYAPRITAGRPTMIPSSNIFLLGMFFSKNFRDAPKPKRTVETL